jgi:hypothetical protein
MRLRLHPAALVELDEAVRYLEEQREGFVALAHTSRQPTYWRNRLK